MIHRKLIVKMVFLLVIGGCTTQNDGAPQSTLRLTASVTATPAATATPTTRPTITPRPTRTATPEPCVKLRSLMPQEEANRLLIAYVNNDDVWLWKGEDCKTRQLTEYGDVARVLLSDDGEIIVFGRRIPLEPYDHEYELLAMNSDGTEQRVLITAEEFLNMYAEREANFEILEFQPNQMAWLPDSHTLVFNTICCPPFPIRWRDMRFLDVDTGLLANVLSAGQGGIFHIAPDGNKIAISTTESISVYDIKTNTILSNIFSYPLVITHSEFYFYAQPYWSEDSQTMTVAIPSIEPFDPGALISIWEIDLSTNNASQTGSFEGIYDLAFSPDLKHLVFSTNNDIHIGELNNFEYSLYLPESRFSRNADWNANSEYFLYQPARDRLVIGSPNAEPIDLKRAAESYFGINWVTEDIFNFGENMGGDMYNIYLGEKTGLHLKLLDLVSETSFSPPSFDVILLPN